MTKNEAREALAATWRFERTGDLISLREVELIGVVRAHETTYSSNPPRSFDYVDTQVQPTS